MTWMNEGASGQCTNPRIAAWLTSYCFEDSAPEERAAVEEHLLECDVCWTEFQRLDGAVRTLRSDPTVKSAIAAREVVTMLGTSGRLEGPFGGHLGFVATIITLFGLDWTIGLWTQLGYAYDRFGPLAWKLSAPVGLWAGATLLLALWVNVRAARAGRTTGLRQSVVVTIAGLGILIATVVLLLPAERTIQASFETRTASAGYLKDALFTFLLLLAFVLPTYHAVVRLQRELASGRHLPVLRFLRRSGDGLAPRGVLYFSPGWLAVFLFTYGVFLLAGAGYTLDALRPGAYAQLFMVAAYISTAAWFASGIVCLWWYLNGLNELQREAKALATFEQRDPDAAFRRQT